ncbi:hypothetical protein CCH79_00019079 [Gambusia affinis]|uniref:Uncharacterized protein n=1 Tax=Gambusia affinis TaxID=33528 RepID=A0A315VPQ0_GAMAF|nr:hypothetical protein CCH79_00019079 [Gambusia affinis]
MSLHDPPRPCSASNANTSVFLTDETEYEYSGSEEEDEERDIGEPSSIINIPGESTLRRDFLRLQLANKERSELIRRQQLEQQQNEEHKRQLLAERQKRIEEQKEQRRRLEEQQRRERELRKQQERDQRRRYEEMEQLRREEERRHAEREQEYIRRQLEEEQRQLEILQQQLLQEQALLLEYKRKQIEEQRQAERLQRQLQHERAYLVSLQQQQEPPRPPQDKTQLYHYKDQAPSSNDKPAWAKEVMRRAQSNSPRIPAKKYHSFMETRDVNLDNLLLLPGYRPPSSRPPSYPVHVSPCRDHPNQPRIRITCLPEPEPEPAMGPGRSPMRQPDSRGRSPARRVEEHYKMNRQDSPALQHKVSNRISDPALPPRSESFSSGGIQQARTPPMHRSVEPQVPQRTTSISPALVRKNSPGNGPGLGPRAGAHLIRASNPDLRRTDISMETPLKRTSSGSSSSSSTPSSKGGSNERGNSTAKTDGSTLSSHDAKDDSREPTRPSRPADLTALAKELRELRQGEETSRPPVKVTDYSSSSEESHSSEDEEGEGGANDGSVAVSDIPRIMPPSSQSTNESFGGMGGHNDAHGDPYGDSTQDSTLMMRERFRGRRRSSAPGNSYHGSTNLFLGNTNLPDLVQQSTSPPGRASLVQYGMGGSGGSKASFTPFVDPRVYGTSPTEDDEKNSAAALFADELLKQEQEQARLNEARKISVVNVNPTNIRPHSDTPEIRKYKKRFNSEILCAALWGETPADAAQGPTCFCRK